MKNLINSIRCAVILVGLLFISCEDYLELETPDQKIISEAVFENDETAQSAMRGIYNQLATVPFSSGGANSVTVLAGLSADDISTIYDIGNEDSEFNEHEISPDNSKNLNLWSSAYNIIYSTNSLLEGVRNSDQLSDGVVGRLEGESKFVRAFTYFYLVNLFGDVPLVTTTDYQKNSMISRTPKEEVYEKIVEDLTDASNLLASEYSSGERTQVTKAAAHALMARVQLYLQNWIEAENYSSQVIADSNYRILQNLNEVFLKNSQEAIWQLSPYGRGLSLTNTLEASNFVIDPFFYFFAALKLNDEFIQSFDDEDHRLNNWVGYNEALGVFFPYKYKVQNSTDEATEYSMVLRLAEQYLIRAEARARSGDLTGAISDLDVIKMRAGLDPIAEFNPNISETDLVTLIIEERNKELFTEWGHRWLDLKRAGMAEAIFEDTNGWESTDVLYPIPESELIKNPNLIQNDGY
ncbi:RagB/SusD domain-containing protein [Salinimicrobium catena]|uniref:RagB/SusD domain-containing protein n=1 Tax=Salinimicrobium catena TaxID=390640 RepID=A0A1H5MTM5_9FLAO|nr:RagB/SusD family nutrient uptake outer membrane protein [Salinimicrobium catena]SDL28349.1 SusD family protein [Salinimicrobium catena]SEE92001.1 RagB/SusD domain-containing protein [Salinimicrobium catena]